MRLCFLFLGDDLRSGGHKCPCTCCPARTPRDNLQVYELVNRGWYKFALLSTCPPKVSPLNSYHMTHLQMEYIDCYKFNSTGIVLVMSASVGFAVFFLSHLANTGICCQWFHISRIAR